jgi:mannose-6-phosphate isomerase-like protein (cupin superfamily)
MNCANSQTPATATTTASMRPAPAHSSRRLPAAGTPYLLGAGDGQDLWFLGNLVTWKATGEQTHGRLTIAEFVHPAGFAPPLHRHLHEDEIFYILSGTAEFRCKGEQLRAAAGDFVLLPVGEPHTFLVGNREPLHALQITTPSGFEHFAAAAGRPATGPPQDDACPTPHDSTSPRSATPQPCMACRSSARHHTTDTKPGVASARSAESLPLPGTTARMTGATPRPNTNPAGAPHPGRPIGPGRQPAQRR